MARAGSPHRSSRDGRERHHGHRKNPNFRKRRRFKSEAHPELLVDAERSGSGNPETLHAGPIVGKTLNDVRSSQRQLKKAKSTPDSDQAIDALERILSKAQERSADRIIGLLVNLESAPNPAQLVYQLLSGYHCHQENWPQVRRISGNGLQQYPQVHSLKNNLAWALAHQNSPDLPRALELVTDAVTSAGEHPIQLEYLATRGTLHRLSSQWTDTIADLEKVLSHLPHRSQLKTQLAESYTQVGQPELAASLLEDSEQTDLSGN